MLKCPECGTLFYYKEDLEAHVKAWHDPKGPYYLMCPKCGKRFESRNALREHLLRHPKEEDEEKRTTLAEELFGVED